VKGLEWPVVILPFVNRKQTPAPRVSPEIVSGKKSRSAADKYRLWADPHSARNNAERLPIRRIDAVKTADYFSLTTAPNRPHIPQQPPSKPKI
jgi:ATP-dependent exoDNAse (exonuclease V) beta subunit